MQSNPITFYEQWTQLDDRDLVKNPISVRLPVHIAARLAALCDLIPNRSRSDFIVDLLKCGLTVLEEESFPVKELEWHQTDGIGPSLQFVLGMSYRESANKHYRQMATDLGSKNVADLFPVKEKGQKSE